MPPDEPAQEDRATVHEPPRRQRRKLRPVVMQLNFTSMIDVIFLLMIYFIVTASFAVDEGILTARLPEGTGKLPAKPKTPERPIRISLTSLDLPTDCRIELVGVGRSPRDFPELARQLAALQHNDSNPNGSFKADNLVIIEPDGHVRWQHVVNAFNAAVKSRYKNVAFAQAQEE